MASRLDAFISDIHNKCASSCAPMLKFMCTHAQSLDRVVVPRSCIFVSGNAEVSSGPGFAEETV